MQDPKQKSIWSIEGPRGQGPQKEGARPGASPDISPGTSTQLWLKPTGDAVFPCSTLREWPGSCPPSPASREPNSWLWLSEFSRHLHLPSPQSSTSRWICPPPTLVCFPQKLFLFLSTCELCLSLRVRPKGHLHQRTFWIHSVNSEPCWAPAVLGSGTEDAVHVIIHPYMAFLQALAVGLQ